MDELERQKRLADVSEQLRKEEEELIFSRSEEGKQVRALEDKIQKTKDLRRKEEELGKTQEKLREELKESLLAPFKSMLEMIPKPIRILGKMAGLGVKKMFGFGGKTPEIKEENQTGLSVKKMFGFGGEVKKLEIEELKKQTALLKNIVKMMRPADSSKANEAALEGGGGGGGDGGDTTVVQNQTIKKGGFLRGLLYGLLSKGRFKAGAFISALMTMFFLAAKSLLASIGVAFVGLKALGMFALPAAIVVFGVASTLSAVKDYFDGYNEGGLSGAIGQALGGSGKGLLNSIKQGSKWAGIGAMIGMFTPFGVVGAVAGAIIGGALGAIFGFIGGEKIKKWIDGASLKVKESWIMFKAWSNNLIDNFIKFFYDPQVVIDESGQELSRGPLKILGVEVGPLWENVTEKVSNAWEGLKSWFGNLVTATGKFFYDPQIEIDESGQVLSRGPVKIFGVALGPLWDTVTEKVSNAWQGLKSWLDNLVTSIGKFFWDGEKGEIFGMKLPEFSFPSISLDSFMDKLKAFIRPLVEKMPSLLLPDSLAEWVGIDPKVKEKEAKLESLEAEEQGIISELNSTEVSPEDAMSPRQEDLYKRLDEIKKEKQILKSKPVQTSTTLRKASKGYIQPTMDPRELGQLSNKMLEEERNPEAYIKSLVSTSAGPAGALNQASFAGAGAGGSGVTVANANINAGTSVTNNTTINTKPKDSDTYTSKQKRTERANW
jgi:hypothetical protein